MPRLPLTGANPAASPRHWTSIRLLPVVAVLVPLSILALVGWFVWQAAWREARSEMDRSAESAAEYAKRALEGYSVTAGRINDRLMGLSDKVILESQGSLHLEVKAILDEQSQTEVSYVLDRDGYALLSSDLFPVVRTVSLADRDYFQAFRVPEPPDIFISETFFGRFDNRLLFSLARPRTQGGNDPSPDGFDGLVVVSVRPAVLAEGLRSLLPGPTDKLALVRTDGAGLSTTNTTIAEPVTLQPVPAQSPFHAFARAGEVSAVYESTDVVSDRPALIAMQKVDGFPVYAVSLRPRSVIVAAWWSNMVLLLAFGLPATLGLFVLALRVRRDQSLLRVANATLRLDNELTSNRLDRAKRFGLVGTFEFDLASGISRRSPEYMSIHGMSATPAIETHDDWARRLHPDDRERAEAEVFEALADNGPTEYGQTYRIVTAEGDVRWIAARGEIRRDAAGRATMLLGAHVDVTPLRTTEIALSESDARLRLAQEAIGIGVWEFRFKGRVLTGSRKFLELVGLESGGPKLKVAQLLSRIPREDRRALLRDLTRVGETGGLVCEVRLMPRGAPSEQATRWIAVRATITTAQGDDGGVMGIAYDITERKRAEEMTALMAREVEHRAKNALSIVLGLLRMTKAENVKDLAQILDARIRALSSTMSLLGRGGWLGAALHDVLQEAIVPFAGDDAQSWVTLEGPDLTVAVNAAQPLSMALHELATNAAKYGALSVPTGRLHVSWSETDGQVAIRWVETGGPPLPGPPPRLGFGSRLIASLFEGQLHGSVKKHWNESGLVCDITFRPGDLNQKDDSLGEARPGREQVRH